MAGVLCAIRIPRWCTKFDPHAALVWATLYNLFKFKQLNDVRSWTGWEAVEQRAHHVDFVARDSILNRSNLNGQDLTCSIENDRFRQALTGAIRKLHLNSSFFSLGLHSFHPGSQHKVFTHFNPKMVWRHGGESAHLSGHQLSAIILQKKIDKQNHCRCTSNQTKKIAGQNGQRNRPQRR